MLIALLKLYVILDHVHEPGSRRRNPRLQQPELVQNELDPLTRRDVEVPTKLEAHVARTHCGQFLPLCIVCLSML